MNEEWMEGQREIRIYIKKSKYGCVKWEKLQIGRRKVISNEGFQGCKERRKESLDE